MGWILAAAGIAFVMVLGSGARSGWRTQAMIADEEKKRKANGGS